MEYREKFVKEGSAGQEALKEGIGKQGTGKKEFVEPDTAKLFYELTYRRYLINSGRVRSFFKKLSTPEYLILYMVKEGDKTDGIYSGRTYLKDIADYMQLTVRQTSRMVKALQERGMLAWSHDGDGSEGTYVTVTEDGLKTLKEEEDASKGYYGKVIANFGRENFIQLLRLMKQLDTVMNAEFEEMEGITVGDDGTDA